MDMQTLEAPDTTDAEPDATEDQAAGRGGLGRALDIAGIFAGVVLGVILFDVLSGGKITRWAQAKRDGGQGGPGGCEGCGGDGAQGGPGDDA